VSCARNDQSPIKKNSTIYRQNVTYFVGNFAFTIASSCMPPDRLQREIGRPNKGSDFEKTHNLKEHGVLCTSCLPLSTQHNRTVQPPAWAHHPVRAHDHEYLQNKSASAPTNPATTLPKNRVLRRRVSFTDRIYINVFILYLRYLYPHGLT